MNMGYGHVAQTKQQIMAELAATIQKKWGKQAVRRGSEVLNAASFAPISTSFSKLDALLLGGILPGQITELCGVRTSGVTTLALKMIANSQALGEKVIYVDFALTFHPKYATACKVQVDDLLIVRPASSLEGIEIATDLLLRYSATLLVFGHAKHGNEAESRAALRRLVNAVRRSSCAFVVLNRASNTLFSPFHGSAATRIQMQQVRWMHQWGIVHGYLSRARITKLNGSDCEHSVILRFNSSKPGDHLQ